MEPEEKPSESTNNPTSLKPKPPVWEAWPTIWFGLAVFAIYFVVQSLVAVVFAVIAAVNQYAANPELDPFKLVQNLSTNGLMISIAVICSGIAGLGFIYLFIKIHHGATVKEYLGLKSFRPKILVVLAIVFFGLIALSAGLETISPQDNANQMFGIEAYKTAIWPALFWIAVVVFAPLFEESFFRGFLLVGLRQSRVGAAGAVIITSLAWATTHIQYNLLGMANILVLGIVFGIVRLKTGSLWSTLLLHSLWNLVAMIGTILYIHGIGT